MPNHIQNRLQVIGSAEQVKAVLSFIADVEDGEPIQMNFNKIIPMPEDLNIQVHSGIEMWVKICYGQYNFKAMLSNARSGSSYGEAWIKNGFDDMINYMGASTAFEALLGENGRLGLKDFKDDDFAIFIKALKNQRQYGHMYWHSWRQDNWGTKWDAYQQNDHRNSDNTIYFQTAWAAPIVLIERLSELFPLVSLVFSFADEDTGSNTGRIVFKNGEEIESFKPINQSKDAYDMYFELHPDSRSEYKLVGDKYEYIETED